MPLVLKVYLPDHRGSLDNPNIWSTITSYHSDFNIASTFRICSHITHISITWPSYEWIHKQGSQVQIRCLSSVDQWWTQVLYSHICYYLSAENLLPSHWTNDDLLMHQWFIPDEKRYHQYQTTLASPDMQSHIRDKLVTNNQFFRALSTEWTYTNQFLSWLHFLDLSK